MAHMMKKAELASLVQSHLEMVPMHISAFALCS